MGLDVSGKVEELVYVQFNGETYTRRAPQRKKDSSAPRMLLNQQRFREVNSFCGQFKYSVILQIWNGAAEKMNGYAFFMKSYMAAFAPDGSIRDAKKLRFPTGKLRMPQGLEAGRPELGGSVIEVSLPKDLHLGQVHLKNELIFISAAGGQYIYITATGITRGALNGSFELPPQPVGAMHIYLFFCSIDHRDYSESVCFEV